MAESGGLIRSPELPPQIERGDLGTRQWRPFNAAADQAGGILVVEFHHVTVMNLGRELPVAFEFADAQRSHGAGEDALLRLTPTEARPTMGPWTRPTGNAPSNARFRPASG